MADDSISGQDRDIGEIEGILQDENGHIRRSAENHSPREVYEAGEKIKRAVTIATKHGGQLEQKVQDNAEELENEIAQLKGDLQDTGGRIPNFSENIQQFQEFFDILEEHVVGKNEVLDPSTLLMGGNGKLILNGGETYGLKKADRDVREVIKKDLNPLTQRNFEDEHVELQTLNNLVKKSVSLHSELNEYRKLLYLAVQDEELLEEFNQNQNMPELNNVGSDIQSSREELIGRIEEIEEIERRVVEALEEASRIISDRLNYDENLLEKVREDLGSNGSGFRNSAEGYYRILEVIEQQHTSGRVRSSWDHDGLKETVEILEGHLNELQNQVNYVINNYSKEEQEIYQLNQAVEKYVDEHNRLMREGENLSDDLSSEGPSRSTSFDSQEFDPRSDEVPEQAWQLVNVAEEILEFDHPQTLLEEYNRVEQEFKRAFEIEGKDKEGIESFEESMNSIHRKLKSVFEEAEKLAEGHSIGEEKGATKLTEDEIRTLARGNRNIGGFEEIISDIEKLSSKIQRLHSLEDSERNTFAELKQDLESVLSDVNDYLRLWKNDEGTGYIDLHNEMMGQRWDGRGVEAADLWGAARRTAAYKLFMDNTEISNLDGAEEKFKEEIRDRHQVVSSLEDEIEESEELLEHEVVLIEGDGDRKGELEELQETIRELEDFRTEFIEVVRSTENVTDSMPEELTRKLNKVEERIEEIEQELARLEQAKENDDEDVSHLFKELEAESSFDTGSDMDGLNL